MQTHHAIAALGSLAQETRLAIFRLLVESGPGGLAAGAIADRLGVPTSSLSFHLAHLLRAGLLLQRRESRSLIYSADFDGMNALIGYLTENCCGRRSRVASASMAGAAGTGTPPSRRRRAG